MYIYYFLQTYSLYNTTIGVITRFPNLLDPLMYIYYFLQTYSLYNTTIGVITRFPNLLDNANDTIMVSDQML